MWLVDLTAYEIFAKKMKLMGITGVSSILLI